MAYTDHFEAYFRKELSIRESLEFEERLASDPELKAQYRDFTALMHAIHAPTREAMRQKIKRLAVEQKTEQVETGISLQKTDSLAPNQKKTKVIQLWTKPLYRIASVAAALACIYIGYQWIKELNNVTSPSLALEHWEKHHELVAPGLTSQNDAFLDLEAIALYDKRNLTGLARYLQQHDDSAHAHLLFAILLLQKNKTISKAQVRKAIHSFEKVIAAAATPAALRDEASWGLAKCKISLGELNTARAILKNLAESSQLLYIKELAKIELNYLNQSGKR